MKRILGLDLGTNSIGWAVVEKSDEDNHFKRIVNSGVRIIPMGNDILSKYESGVTVSNTAIKRLLKGMRTLRERKLLRRERLHRVLNVLGFLPDHYANEIVWNRDCKKSYGTYLSGCNPKLPWKKALTNCTKYEFIFKDSFLEMISDFKLHQPDLVADSKRVPYDWTIYYLRKKAISQPIAKEELAWIILQFNSKRGYCQLDEDNGSNNVLEEVIEQRIISIKEGDTDNKNKNKKWYTIILENGMKYSMTFFSKPCWEGEVKEFLVTTKLTEDKIPKIKKNGDVDRTVKLLPSFDEIDALSVDQQIKIYGKIKAKTENALRKSGKTVGCYIYDTMLQKPNQKIIGKLIRTIERDFYKDELKEILQKQKEFHVELQDINLFEKAIYELYPNNDKHRERFKDKTILDLFIDDILYYQRPPKKNKHLVNSCPFERSYIKEGELIPKQVKCISKSHPLYQEFRLWQFIDKLRIYEKQKEIEGKLHIDYDVTNEFLADEEAYVHLFEWLNQQKEINQSSLLKYKLFKSESKKRDLRWNYIEDESKKYPCNTTKSSFISYFKRAGYKEYPLTEDKERNLWHILYSVTDKIERKKAITSFTLKNDLSSRLVEEFMKFPKFPSEYGAYSEKAIKKLLPLMRKGKYWNATNIDLNTQTRINKIINGECDDSIGNRAREKTKCFTSVNQFKGLPFWLASYIVYDRFSERDDCEYWENPSDIDNYIRNFKQHSLRNPIVEKIVIETLRMVRDIWKFGAIDEIHLEIGREMKKTAEERKRSSVLNIDNENRNIRIKKMLIEFLKPDFEVENVRPYSPNQQEILKIYEESVLNGENVIPDEIALIIKKFNERNIAKQPTSKDILRYKLWLDQKYQSPYTGEFIPIGKLFTSDYQIEHVIPKKRFLDDSFSNKVICEAAVNQLKGDLLGMEFILIHGGEIVELGQGRKVHILSKNEYQSLVKNTFARSSQKMKKLLMEDVPADFINRQQNDNRYISKFLKSILSSIVREKDEIDDISKNLIVCTGGVADQLKQAWGMNDVWNSIITPRFERMNQRMFPEVFGQWENKNGKNTFQINMPIKYARGFSKKRIDHRHHSMDAIVIACTTRNHINYLNNMSSNNMESLALKKLLCIKTRVDENGNYRWVFIKPWQTFTEDSYIAISNIIVSFKQDLRILNKSTNHYTKYDENGEKKIFIQTRGDRLSIRKSMHTLMPYGKREYEFDVLPILGNVGKCELILDDKIRYEVKKRLALFNGAIGKTEKDIKKNPIIVQNDVGEEVECLVTAFSVKLQKFRRRQPISKLTNRSTSGLDSLESVIKFINKVCDKQLRSDLLFHLEQCSNDIDVAFSQEGIDRFNKKRKIPVYRLPIAEQSEARFRLGNSIDSCHKWVEADKGTNLYFAIYQADGSRSRIFETIPLNIVIERLKLNWSPVPEFNRNGDKLLFFLSPNDLVYLPSIDQCDKLIDREDIDLNRIYKMVSCTDREAHFIPYSIAYPIVKLELGANNKAERAWTGEIIKESCVPIKVNRLGTIVQINGRKVK